MLTVVSGATDFAMPLFLLYGRQWLYGTAALAHGIQVVAVFIIVIKDFGLFWWNFLTFWSTWMYVRPLAILAACAHDPTSIAKMVPSLRLSSVLG